MAGNGQIRLSAHIKAILARSPALRACSEILVVGNFSILFLETLRDLLSGFGCVVLHGDTYMSPILKLGW